MVNSSDSGIFSDYCYVSGSYLSTAFNFLFIYISIHFYSFFISSLSLSLSLKFGLLALYSYAYKIILNWQQERVGEGSLRLYEHEKYL